MKKGITIFDTENDSKGLKAVMKRNGKIIKETYALNLEHANWILNFWKNEFWGFRLN